MRKGEDENGWEVKRGFDWKTREVKVERRSILDLASVKAQEKQREHKKETKTEEST